MTQKQKSKATSVMAKMFGAKAFGGGSKMAGMGAKWGRLRSNVDIVVKDEAVWVHLSKPSPAPHLHTNTCTSRSMPSGCMHAPLPPPPACAPPHLAHAGAAAALAAAAAAARPTTAAMALIFLTWRWRTLRR